MGWFSRITGWDEHEKACREGYERTSRLIARSNKASIGVHMATLKVKAKFGGRFRVTRTLPDDQLDAVPQSLLDEMTEELKRQSVGFVIIPTSLKVEIDAYFVGDGPAEITLTADGIPASGGTQ